MKKFAKITAVALVAVLALMALVACGYNSDPKKAKANLEKQGYEVTLLENPTSIGDVTATINATKKDDGKLYNVFIVYYKDADAAKEAFNGMKDTNEKAKEEAKKNGNKYSCNRYGNQIVTKISGEID